jgi:hypothetical protein
MESLPMILPFIAVIVCLVWFKEETIWWEAAIPFAAVALFILIFKFAAESVATSDDEYWTGYVNTAEYYEDWDEEVPCRHPRYCTRTTTDSKGNTRTESYQCGWQHAYDVDYHPEYWAKVDHNGISHLINRSEYDFFVRKFGNRSFVNMNRDYHSNDGDMYQATWPSTDATLESMVTVHSYENRVQASSSVFNFPEVDTSDIRKYKLFNYPGINNFDKQRHILGANNKVAERKMEILNAKLGRKKEVKAFILVYKGQPIKAAEIQEAYWKGGNKNEFIVCIGTDKSGKKTNWVHIISWNLDKTLNVKVRNWVLGQDNLNLPGLVDMMYPEINTHFRRQSFEEFSYLKVELTSGQLIAIWIVSFILSAGLAVWIIMNPINDESESYRTRYSSSNSRLNWRIRF